MTPKVIFVNIPHPVLQEKLEAAGYQCDMAGDWTLPRVEKAIHQYTGMIINSRFYIGPEFLEKSHALKFIGRVGSGMDGIDVEYARQKGIRCFNSPEGNRDAVAEHAMGLLLSLLNNIPLSDDQVRRLKWLRDENRGVEIKGKTIGIIGYGNMGSALAERLAGFGARVIAYDKYKKGFSNGTVRACPLKELQEESDIISLHVPLTDETRYMFNAAFIKKCKKSFWLVNTSRGKVVDTEALVSALRSGKVRGAALDVLEYEDVSFEKMNLRGIPAPLEYLLSADNVVLTPHVAGWTVESKFKLADVLADKILAEFSL